MRRTVRFLRRGQVIELGDVAPTEMLLDHLRLREGACGTKEGCAEGDCGACTVALGRVVNGRLVYEPVNSCILLTGMVDGKDVVAVDDLAPDGAPLHPVQQAMVDYHGSQCGFCTPGFVMSLFTLYQSGARPDRRTVTDWLAGNLCRCTGYRPIVDAALAACDGHPADSHAQGAAATVAALRQISDGEDVIVGDERRFFAAPASLQSLAELYAAHQDATIVAGATDVGLWVTKQLRDLAKIIHVGRVAGFDTIHEEPGALVIGAGATYAQAEPRLAAIDPDLGELLRRLGSKQVRASGTIGGNIANGSPVGDMPPALSRSAPRSSCAAAAMSEPCRWRIFSSPTDARTGGQASSCNRYACPGSPPIRLSAATRFPSVSTRTSPPCSAPSASPSKTPR
jgi:xanthine dehydrogenase small subunit